MPIATRQPQIIVAPPLPGDDTEEERARREAAARLQSERDTEAASQQDGGYTIVAPPLPEMTAPAATTAPQDYGPPPEAPPLPGGRRGGHAVEDNSQVPDLLAQLLAEQGIGPQSRFAGQGLTAPSGPRLPVLEPGESARPGESIGYDPQSGARYRRPVEPEPPTDWRGMAEGAAAAVPAAAGTLAELLVKLAGGGGPEMLKDILQRPYQPPNPNDPLEMILGGLPMIAGPAFAARGANPVLRALLGVAGQDVIDVGADVARGARAAIPAAREAAEAAAPAVRRFAESEVGALGGLPAGMADDAARAGAQEVTPPAAQNVSSTPTGRWSIGETVTPTAMDGTLFPDARITDIQTDATGQRWYQMEGSQSYIPEGQVQPPTGTSVPPPVEADPIAAAHAKLSGLKSPNAATAARELDKLEKQAVDLDLVDTARDALTEFSDIVRVDFEDAAEFRATRQEAWDNFLSVLEGEPAPIPQTALTQRERLLRDLAQDDAALAQATPGSPAEAQLRANRQSTQAALDALGPETPATPEAADVPSPVSDVRRNSFSAGGPPAGGFGGGRGIPPGGVGIPGADEIPMIPNREVPLRTDQRPAVVAAQAAPTPEDAMAAAPPTPGQSPIVNAALAAAGAPPLPPVKSPRGPRPPGSGPLPPAATPPAVLPKFSPQVEAGLVHAHNVTGIDEPMLRYAVAQAQVPANAPGTVRSFFNTIGSVVNEALARNPDVQSSYLSASRYSQQQTQRINAEVNLTERMILESLGPEAMSGVKVPDLVARFRGPKAAMNDYVGTGWHVLQRADDYDLTPLQRRAVREWKQIADDDLHFTQRELKMPIGEVDDVYVAHSFKDPLAAEAALHSGAGSVGNRGVPSVARNRNLSVEDYIKFAEKHDLEIETNLSILLAKRLAATAKLRSNGIFLEELAKKTGGRRLAPFTGPQIATPNIVRNGAQQWQFPSEIADQIEVLTRKPDNSTLAKSAEGVVDTARAALLNLDFSVGGGRQAFLGFLVDPVGYAKSMKAAYNIGTDSEFGWLTWYNNNIERLTDGTGHGLNLSSLNITDVANVLPGETPHFFERGRFNPIRALNDIQFKMIMPEMKLGRYETIFEALKMARDNKGVDAMINKLPVFGTINRKLGGRLYTATDDELKDIAAEAANNLLGGIEWAKVGHAPGRDAGGILRKVMVLTEGWTRAQVGLLTRSAQANPEGYVARRLLMSEVAMVSGLATGLSLALSGKLPEYDPRSGQWLDVVTPWGYVSILPHKSALQFAIRLVAGNKPGEYGSDDPAMLQRWDAVAHFVSGRVGQIPRVAGELGSGKDYYGNPITNYPAYFAQTFSPIIAGRIMRDVQQEQEPTGIAVRTGEEFLGFSARPFPKSRPGGTVVDGLPEYNTRHETVAEFLGGDDAEKVKALKLYARLDREFDRLQFEDGIESAVAHVSPQLNALKAKIEQQYGEDLLTDYRRGVKQVEAGMAKDRPALKAYLESLGKTFKEPTPTPSPTPTRTPTPAAPTAEPTATKVPQAVNTPKPNATQAANSQDYETGKRVAQAWDRLNPDGTPLDYGQLGPAERKAVDIFISAMDAVSFELYGKARRNLTSAAQREAVLVETVKRHGWPAKPEATPTRTPTPGNTPTPTRTPIPDVYRELFERTPTPVLGR